MALENAIFLHQPGFCTVFKPQKPAACEQNRSEQKITQYSACYFYAG